MHQKILKNGMKAGFDKKTRFQMGKEVSTTVKRAVSAPVKKHSDSILAAASVDHSASHATLEVAQTNHVAPIPNPVPVPTQMPHSVVTKVSHSLVPA